MVRLGDSAFKGVISPDAFARATECIRRYRAQAERAGVDAIIAVATSAVREAENGGDFVRVVRDETGIELTVIRGEQEARLIYLGARAAINLAGQEGAHHRHRRRLGRAHRRRRARGALRHLAQARRPAPPRSVSRCPIRSRPISALRLAEQLHRALEAPTAAIRKIGFDLVAMTSGTARAVAELIPTTTTEKPRADRLQGRVGARGKIVRA